MSRREVGAGGGARNLLLEVARLDLLAARRRRLGALLGAERLQRVAQPHGTLGARDGRHQLPCRHHEAQEADGEAAGGAQRQQRRARGEDSAVGVEEAPRGAEDGAQHEAGERVRGPVHRQEVAAEARAGAEGKRDPKRQGVEAARARGEAREEHRVRGREGQIHLPGAAAVDEPLGAGRVVPPRPRPLHRPLDGRVQAVVGADEGDQRSATRQRRQPHDERQQRRDHLWQQGVVHAEREALQASHPLDLLKIAVLGVVQLGEGLGRQEPRAPATLECKRRRNLAIVVVDGGLNGERRGAHLARSTLLPGLGGPNEGRRRRASPARAPLQP